MLYKVLGENGQPCHGGKGTWNLPKRSDIHQEDGTWVPGEWMPEIDPIVPCHRGYHLCLDDQIIEWLGPTICIAESKGTIINTGNKCVTGQARLLSPVGNWNDNVAWDLAFWGAQRVAHVWPMPHVVSEYLQTRNPRLRHNALDSATHIVEQGVLYRGTVPVHVWQAALAVMWTLIETHTESVYMRLNMGWTTVMGLALAKTDWGRGWVAARGCFSGVTKALGSFAVRQIADTDENARLVPSVLDPDPAKRKLAWDLAIRECAANAAVYEPERKAWYAQFCKLVGLESLGGQ